MKKNFFYTIAFVYVVLLVIVSCKKDKQVPENPFDDPKNQSPPTSGTSYNPSPTSFEYLYHNVFKPTCANSGCHDGSFEPDFRNISSSYNSMVYAPVIITPTNNPYTYRVLPGNSAQSLLRHRLTQMPGSGPGTLGQGRMPWNDTNWRYVPTNATNIQNIISWIDAGAKDIYGNTPMPGNKHPNTMGLHICNTGSPTHFVRSKYITLSKNNGPIDLWCYIVDDNTPPQNMVSAEIKFSLNRFDFSSAVTQTLSYVSNGTSFIDMPLTGTVQYNYKLTNFNLNTILNDTGYIFMRTYIRDTDHTTPAETPNNGSAYYTDYFVIKVTP